MPELPEVETIRRQPAPLVEGRALRRVEVLDPVLVAAAVHGAFDFVWHVPAVVLLCAALAAVMRGSDQQASVAPSRSHRDQVRGRRMRGALI